MNTRKKGQSVTWVTTIILLASMALYITPLLFALNTSFKTSQEFYQNIWSLPSTVNFSNYIEAFQVGKIGTYLMNSIILSALSLISIQILALTASYALSRLHVPYTEVILLLFILIQILPTESMIIPLYVTVSRIGLLNIPFASTVLGYVGWSLPGTIIIMKNYFDTIPIELLESARIDGSSELRTLLSIILPLMRGPMVACLMLNYTYVWGELMWAQITTLLTDKGIPITVGLLNFQGTYATNWPLLTAAICMILIPLFMVFTLTQKHVIAGLTAGGIKG